jgi:hypothetical protein
LWLVEAKPELLVLPVVALGLVGVSPEQPARPRARRMANETTGLMTRSEGPVSS